jgi:ABC-type Fe3+ transport system substrate-binding protein
MRGRCSAVSTTPTHAPPERGRGSAVPQRYLNLPDVDFATSSTLLTFDRAAHPTAARLFANWVLVQEAQAVLARSLPTNSGRTDVAPGSPDEAVAPGSPAGAYYKPDREVNLARAADTQRFVRGLFDRTR